MLATKAQVAALKHGAQIPSNAKTKAPPECAEVMEKFQGYMKTAVTVDWDTINEKRPEWNQRWNKEIER